MNKWESERNRMQVMRCTMGNQCPTNSTLDRSMTIFSNAIGREARKREEKKPFWTIPFLARACWINRGTWFNWWYAVRCTEKLKTLNQVTQVARNGKFEAAEIGVLLELSLFPAFSQNFLIKLIILSIWHSFYELDWLFVTSAVSHTISHSLAVVLRDAMTHVYRLMRLNFLAKLNFLMCLWATAKITLEMWTHCKYFSCIILCEIIFDAIQLSDHGNKLTAKFSESIYAAFFRLSEQKERYYTRLKCN